MLFSLHFITEINKLQHLSQGPFQKYPMFKPIETIYKVREDPVKTGTVVVQSNDELNRYNEIKNHYRDAASVIKLPSQGPEEDIVKKQIITNIINEMKDREDFYRSMRMAEVTHEAYEKIKAKSDEAYVLEQQMNDRLLKAEYANAIKNKKTIDMGYLDQELVKNRHALKDEATDYAKRLMSCREEMARALEATADRTTALMTDTQPLTRAFLEQKEMNRDIVTNTEELIARGDLANKGVMYANPEVPAVNDIKTAIGERIPVATGGNDLGPEPVTSADPIKSLIPYDSTAKHKEFDGWDLTRVGGVVTPSEARAHDIGDVVLSKDFTKIW